MQPLEYSAVWENKNEKDKNYKNGFDSQIPWKGIEHPQEYPSHISRTNTQEKMLQNRE